MTKVKLDAPVHLVKGDDEVVLRDGVRELVHALADGLDPGLAVEEEGPEQFSPSDGDTSIRPLVDAAQTPPFLTDRRVVVGRGVEMFTKADQVAPLVAYLDDPLPTTTDSIPAIPIPWCRKRAIRAAAAACAAALNASWRSRSSGKTARPMRSRNAAAAPSSPRRPRPPLKRSRNRLATMPSRIAVPQGRGSLA